MKIVNIIIGMMYIIIFILANQPMAKAATQTIDDTNVTLTTYNNIFDTWNWDAQNGFSHDHSQWVAQTFTAPVTGTFQKVKIAIYKWGNPWHYKPDGTTESCGFGLTINNLNQNGQPKFPPNVPPSYLAGVNVDASNVPTTQHTWTTFTLDQSVSVNQGTRYAIVVYSPACMDSTTYNNCYRWETDAKDSYNQGTVWYVNYFAGNNQIWNSANYDMPFSITITY